MLKFAWLLMAAITLYGGPVAADADAGPDAGAGAKHKVRLMANTSPPYADKKLAGEGLALELVRHIFARTDYVPEITIENWSRAVEGARLGVYDGLAAAWYSEARNQDLEFSEPYLDSKLIILKLRSSPGNYRSLQDLSGARLGVRADYAYGVDFTAIPNLTLVEENHLIQLLLKLQDGSVDFVIGDRRTIIMELNAYMKDNLNQFTVLDIPLPDVQRHVAASRDLAGHEALIEAFNRALAETLKDGSLQAIISKWDGSLGDFSQ
jgi:polar amino acid transport system substrate-binding protein